MEVVCIIRNVDVLSIANMKSSDLIELDIQESLEY